MNRKGKRLEDFLKLFDIAWISELEYIKDFNGTSGLKVTTEAMRMIEEFYHSIKRDILKVNGADYYPPSITRKIIKRVDAIISEIKVKELQHFKASSVGLWCTDKEPKVCHSSAAGLSFLCVRPPPESTV